LIKQKKKAKAISVVEEKKPKKLSLEELGIISEQKKKFDPDATEDDCIRDLRKVQTDNPTKSISRNFYRWAGEYSDATWNAHFGTFHEFRRKAGLELSRDAHSLEKKIAKHASLDLHRDFYDSEVLPYHQKFSRTKEHKGRFLTIVTGSDFHDLDADQFVLSTFIDTCERTQPNVIALNGDVFDNPEFSRFDQDPRDFKILERFNFVKDRIFAPLRAKCPKSQIELIIGNHEYRILKLMAAKTPALKVLLSDVMGLSLSDCFGLEEYEINLVAKLDLSAFNNSDIKEEIKQNFQVYYDCYAVTHVKDLRFGVSGTSGHTHRPDHDIFTTVPMGKCTWVNTGSIAKTNASYLEKFDQAQNSFVIATVDQLKKRVHQNHIVFSEDHVVVEGKLYTRKDPEET
jgi:hypothetical protein